MEDMHMEKMIVDDDFRNRLVFFRGVVLPGQLHRPKEQWPLLNGENFGYQVTLFMVVQT